MSTNLDSEPRSAWDDLTEGRLTPEDEAVLRALAGEDEGAEAAYEAHRPLEEAVRARIADNLTLEVKRRRRSRQLGAAAAAMVAAAAAVLLVFWPGASSEPLAYAMHVSAGLQEERGAVRDDGGVRRFDAHTPFELILRPERQVRGPVQVALFFVNEQQTVRWEPHFERSETGALRVRAPASDLPVGSGRWTVKALVAETLPDEEALRERIRAGGPGVLATQIELVP